MSRRDEFTEMLRALTEAVTQAEEAAYLDALDTIARGDPELEADLEEFLAERARQEAMARARREATSVTAEGPDPFDYDA